MADQIQSTGTERSGGMVLVTSSTIDATGTPNPEIYTVPANRRAIIICAIVRLVGVAAFSAEPLVGIATLPLNDNIFANATLTGLNSTTEIFKFDNGQAQYVSAGSSVYVNIAGSATATQYDIQVDLIGYLV